MLFVLLYDEFLYRWDHASYSDNVWLFATTASALKQNIDIFTHEMNKVGLFWKESSLKALSSVLKIGGLFMTVKQTETARRDSVVKISKACECQSWRQNLTFKFGHHGRGAPFIQSACSIFQVPSHLYRPQASVQTPS